MFPGAAIAQKISECMSLMELRELVNELGGKLARKRLDGVYTTASNFKRRKDAAGPRITRKVWPCCVCDWVVSGPCHGPSVHPTPSLPRGSCTRVAPTSTCGVHTHAHPCLFASGV